ncbi:MAG: translocation/assembly module TamB domain-containing protein [Prosthecobacter sp.]
MSSTTHPKTRRWWRWLKRLVLVGGVALLLGVVFHQALLRALLQYGGPFGAEMAGLSLNWRVAGSVTGDLTLKQVSTSGLMIESAILGELSAEYDAVSAIRTGDVDIIKRVTLKDVDAVIDLRKLPVAEQADAPEKDETGKPPPLVWPKIIDIENVNVVVTLADAKVMTIRGLSLRIGEGMPGVFECDEFKVEPGDLRVADVKAKVQWGGREVTISEVALPYGAELKALKIDLREWEKDAALVRLDATLGKAVVIVEALARGIFGGAMHAEADVRVGDFTSNDWQMPEGVTFGPLNLSVKASGDPTRPVSMAVDGRVDVTDVKAAGVMLDAVSAVFGIKDGLATIDNATVTRGSNEVTASVESRLAEDVMKSRWKAKLQAKIADVTQLLEKPPPARGVVNIAADAEGVGATPIKAAAQVRGRDLVFDVYRLPTLALDVALNGREAKLSLPALMLGEGNRVDLNAVMMMEDEMPVTADWKIQIDDPALLMKTVNLPPLDQPMTAKLATTGKASLELNDPLNANAEVVVSVKEGRFGEASLPTVDLKVAVAKGEALLQSCRVLVDERNHVDLKGKAGLSAPWAFDVNGVVELPEMKTLNALLATFKAPAIEGGGVTAKLAVKGDASPWRGEGRVTLNATQVKVDQMPEPADLDVAMSFVETTATIDALEASLGPWRLVTKGMVTEKRADLNELGFWQQERQLLRGHARASFDLETLDVALNASDLPLHEVVTAAGIKGVPEAVLSLDVEVQGLEDARVSLNLKDVKAPGLPKAFQPAQVDVLTTLKTGRLLLDAKLNQQPLQPLLIKAEAPVVVRELMKNPDEVMNLPLKATLDMAESDLGFVRDFAPEVLKSVPAKLRLNAKVSGTVRAPLIDSIMNLDAPNVAFVSADMPSVRDVKVRLRTSDRKAVIEQISAVLAGGALNLGGSIDAEVMDDPRFDLKVRAREALVFRNPTASLRANADISCVGTLKSARVSGLVEAVRGRVFQEVNLLPNVMNVIKQSEPLPPPPPSTSKVNRKVELPPLLKDWTFDLRVKTRDPVLLAGNLVNGAISADVKLGGSGAKPQLTGFANVDRLLLKLPFSLLKITKGVVTMNPENPFAPQLDVRGESRIGSNDISLYVYGDAENPKTRFTSTPPMSEADIVTMIGTGMTLGGDNAQMASEAMTRAAFLVVSEAWRKLFNKEKKISDEPPKLHMTFNPSGGDRANDSMQAMYELTPKVRFTGRFTQTGRMKALLGYVLRFGKAARAMEEGER